MQKLKEFFSSLLQPDAFATFFNYTIKIFLNPIIVLFVPVFLSENQQGYWYTFGSIAALTTFADLGFTSIMTQYVAHEYTYLKLDKVDGKFFGQEEHIKRMSSLFKFVVHWMGIVLFVALCIILLAGMVMFSGSNDGVKWFLPWVMYALSSVYNFASQVALSFFEGCDQFAITQKIRASSSIIHCITTIGLLAAGMGLYALSIPLIVKGSLVFYFLIRYFGSTFAQLRNVDNDEKIAWGKEIVPLLVRYAISWASGYFSFQIYNPMTFSIFGASAAGKVGYSLSIVQAMYTVSNAWSLISIPKYNMAVEKKEWLYMDSLLRRNLIYSSIVYIMGILALFITKRIPFTEKFIWSRVVSGQSMIILCGAYYLTMISYAISTYLRSHKKEPYMVVSVLSGVGSVILTFIFAQYIGFESIFVGILMTNILVLPIAIYIWHRFKIRWHADK